jgi:hypothetical protein
VLRLDFAYPDGRDMVTYDLRLKPEADTVPAMDVSGLKDVTFPRLNFVLSNNEAKNGMWKQAVRHAGKLVNISLEKTDGGGSEKLKDDAALYAMPLAIVRTMKADLVLADEKSAHVFGRVQANIDRDGKFTYQMKWDAFPRAPSRARTRRGRPTRKCRSWAGSSSCPPASIISPGIARDIFPTTRPITSAGSAGRPRPTRPIRRSRASPRPDAFDFNSTKYNCDWAMLADSSGRGIAIKSTGGGDDARQNCRAGTSSDGRRQLVVNKFCCPPRDISSAIVPDFYLKDKSVSAGFTVGRTTGRQ